VKVSKDYRYWLACDELRFALSTVIIACLTAITIARIIYLILNCPFVCTMDVTWSLEGTVKGFIEVSFQPYLEIYSW
jgi:hypothetical protein